MKTFFAGLFFMLHFLVASQPLDTTFIIPQIDSLMQRCQDHVANSEFEQALQAVEQAERIILEQLGPHTVQYAIACFHHGRTFHFSGEYDAAKTWYEKALPFWENNVSEKYTEYVSNLYNLSLIYGGIGWHEKEEALYLNVLSLCRDVFGKTNPNYSKSLVNLANLYTDLTEYEKAEPLYLEAKDLAAQSFGTTSLDYAENINNLAVLYVETARFEKAERLYLEAKSIWESNGEKEGSNYAACLNNLGNLYGMMGEYELAEPYYFEAKSIRENTLGKQHPDYVQSLDNLAALYQKTGDFERAEKLNLEVISILESGIGANHPDYATSIFNLAVLYRQTKDYPRSEELYLKAMAIREQVLGNNHLDYAATLRNLGYLYVEMGRLESARPLFLQNQSIIEATLGKLHPEYGISLDNLANLNKELGDYIHAEPLFVQALEIWEKVYGETHPFIIQNLSNQAEMYANMGKYEQATPLFTEVAKRRKKAMTKAIYHLSETKLDKYLRLFTDDQNQLLSYAQAVSGDGEDIAATCFDNALFYKGFLLQSVRQVKQWATADPTTSEKWDLLQSYNRRLAKEYTKTADKRNNVEMLQEKANSLEKELTRAVARYGEAIRQVTWEEVKLQLKPKEAAIEFVHYPHSIGQKQTNKIMYAALLLKREMAQPKFIPLFEEKSLDSLTAVNGDRKADYVDQLYTFSGRGAKALSKPKRSLYEMIWQPLEKELKGVQTVYFSPDGQLHRLNLGAIPVDDDRTMADRFHLVELGSTRQLAAPIKGGNTERDISETALLLGGINYEIDTLEIDRQDEFEILAEHGRPIYDIKTPKLRGGGNWDYLKWTSKEVNGLEKILMDEGFQTTVLRGPEASEDFFKTIGHDAPSPRILHLATHGYFFPDPEIAEVKAWMPGDVEGIVFKTSLHPMIRSGLILSGGNYAWENGQSFRPQMEDGILTAFEISQMDLSGTELVVLSACETGLGDIEGNEGVYGLQRAFKIAGAKYLLMSLWQVPDYQTQELMVLFYQKFITEKLDIPAAFRAAQLEMRDKYQSPYFWAGFVLVE